jgi:hypothetical protein
MPVSGFAADSKDGYVPRLLQASLASNELACLQDAFANPSSSQPKIFYKSFGAPDSALAAQDLVIKAKNDYHSSTRAICIIENISPDCIDRLGSEWNITPQILPWPCIESSTTEPLAPEARMDMGSVLKLSTGSFVLISASPWHFRVPWNECETTSQIEFRTQPFPPSLLPESPLSSRVQYTDSLLSCQRILMLVGKCG